MVLPHFPALPRQPIALCKHFCKHFICHGTEAMIAPETLELVGELEPGRKAIEGLLGE
jgi:hypothetical protein